MTTVGPVAPAPAVTPTPAATAPTSRFTVSPAPVSRFSISHVSDLDAQSVEGKAQVRGAAGDIAKGSGETGWRGQVPCQGSHACSGLSVLVPGAVAWPPHVFWADAVSSRLPHPPPSWASRWLSPLLPSLIPRTPTSSLLLVRVPEAAAHRAGSSKALSAQVGTAAIPPLPAVPRSTPGSWQVGESSP